MEITIRDMDKYYRKYKNVSIFVIICLLFNYLPLTKKIQCDLKVPDLGLIDTTLILIFLCCKG